MRVIRASVACLMAVVFSHLGLAEVRQPIDGATQRVRYDDYRMVRVSPRSAEELQRIYELGGRLMSCHESLGPTDYLFAPQDMARLTASGIPFAVTSENVQEELDALWARLDQAPAVAPGDLAWYNDFKDLAAIEAKLNDHVTNHPGLVSIEDIGDTIESRDIWALRISGAGTNKPAVLFNGAQHAREWISPMLNMWIVDSLIDGYVNNDPQIVAILDSIEVIVIPVVNTDGYVYSWGPDRLWRKNRRDNGGGVYGVDTNRNWDAAWAAGAGSSSDPSNPLYHGTAPFSEPETQAMRDFFNANPHIVASIDIHSYTQKVASPWGYTGALPPDHDLFTVMNRSMSEAIFDVHGVVYEYGPIFSAIYVVNGSAIDWCYDDQGVFAFTIELRPEFDPPGFILPADEIIPTCEENWEAVLYLLEWATTPVHFTYPEGIPAFVDADTTTAMLVDITDITRDPIQTGSEKLFYRYAGGGAFNESLLTGLGGVDYEATFPASPCGAEIEFYLQATRDDGTIATDPADAPTSLYHTDVVQFTTVFADDFEADEGWSTAVLGASSGDWQRGEPVNDPNWDYDPISDSDGSGQCYLTQNETGNTDVDGGAVELSSPVFDFSAGGVIEYDYFLNLNDTDSLIVEISPNGSDWTLIVDHNTDGDLAWRSHSISSAEIEAQSVALTSTMQLRFTASDAGAASIVEAGVDAFQVSEVGCDAVCASDLNNDTNVDINDVFLLLGYWGGAGGPGDLNGDNNVDINDVFFLLGQWGPC